MRRSYLIDAIECGLDGLNIPGALTAQQVSDLAASLEVSLENESMATGRDQIPNPMDAELRRVRQAHTESVASLERGHTEQVRELEWLVSRLRSRIHDLEQERVR